MKNYKIKNKLALALIAISFIASGCSNAQTKSSSTSTATTAVTSITDKYSDRDLDPSWDESTATKITLSGNSITTSGYGAQEKNGSLIIQSGGTYVLSGTLDSAQIIVEAPDTDKVQIVFNNVSITNKDSIPLNIKTADKVFLTLADNTTNKIVDNSGAATSNNSNTSSVSNTSTNTANSESTATNSTDNNSSTTNKTDLPDAAIYSKCNLTINGNGSLTVNSNNNEGIKSKDELVITGGNIKVDSKGDALTGKDSIAIKGGSFDLNSSKDGIKSSNSTDTSKGWISIDGGTFKISAANDGIDAETILEINAGDFDITTGNGGEAVSKQSQENSLGGRRKNDMRLDIDQQNRIPQSNSKFDNQGNMMAPPNKPDSNSSATQNNPAQRSSPKAFSDNKITTTTSSRIKNQNNQTIQAGDLSTHVENSNSSESSKGLKAGTDLIVNNGSITVNAEEDALHSNKNININGGNLNVKAGDDGIHSEEILNITNESKVTISNSYEGIESKVINIKGGTISIVSSDDGINGASGNSDFQGMRGGRESAQNGVSVNISGGSLTVNAQGDGLDSNADINITGGKTIVYGPSNGGNGSLDYTGTAKITNGTFVAIGTADMYQGFDDSSTQNTVTFGFSSTQSENQALTLVDSNNNVITSFKAQKSYQALLISSDKLKEGEIYALYSGGTISENSSKNTSGEDSSTNSKLNTSGSFSGGEKITQFTLSKKNTVINI
ncbi:carbohydrate-binding domain-containing protein [Peptostreptococcus sp. D1]|uniref:carbohydrate-binding domain-containing protein n=1 Tax=Peptostreptococcus sp. D1 TaxID=72304 RepID=UPI0008E70652|nr:carbohydrate-binding domain-containing protein [Peptostreptococcus sp. D1]SFE78253.1 protein of unknown function [Peptostreptococcus sp. D1]